MPTLLHEYWEVDTSGEFSFVQESLDLQRLVEAPHARLRFSLYASSWDEAMQARNERLGYDDYLPLEGISDVYYTEEQAIEQKLYLARRTVIFPKVIEE